MNLESEFTAGVDRFLEAGTALDSGETTRLISTAQALSYAIYRVPLGGEEPGVISVDANPRGARGYYVGLANYLDKAWDWHGPFRDNHVRLSTSPDGDYTSDAGLVFICVAVWDGAEADVVGLGINAVVPGDTEAPPAPPELSAERVVDGVDLSWIGVPDADVAGYRIYHSTSPIPDALPPGQPHLDYLVGETAMTLVDTGSSYFRVTTVDFNCNESSPSPQAFAVPLPGEAPVIVLSTDVASCQRGETVILEASGAEVYDWDVDGDGSFEIMGDTTGFAEAATGSTGLIRPKVRGQSGYPESRACGSVSLIVSGICRPLAIAHVFPATGQVPLEVNLEGEAFDYDGEVVGAGWDLNGDGIYELWDPGSMAHQYPPPQIYPAPGLFNVRFRIVDNDGAYDVDTVAVNPLPEPMNLPPIASFIASKYKGTAPLEFVVDASGSTDLDGAITLYEWDWESDGTFDVATDSPEYAHVFDSPWDYRVTLRVTDEGGAMAATSRTITATGPVRHTVESTFYFTETSLLVVAGNPAIFYGEHGTFDLRYVRADDPLGSSWGNSVLVSSDIDGLHHHGTMIANGNPAVVYLKSGNMEFVRAADATGTSWGSPVSVATTGFLLTPPPLIDVGGRPATAYYDIPAPYRIVYSRADDVNGSAWSSPVTAQSLTNQGYRIDLAMAEGRPAIGYIEWDGLLRTTYKRADDATGAGWTGLPIIFGTPYAIRFSMAIINGIPAMAWHTDDGTHQEIRYVRADDPAGSTWTFYYPRTVLDRDWVCFNIDLIELDGRPAVAGMSGTTLVPRYSHASDPDGLNWSDFMAFDTGGDTGLGLSGALVAGRAAFSYIDDMNKLVRFSLIVE